jgi:hypothetical protein
MGSFNSLAEQQGSYNYPPELQLPLVKIAGYFRQPLLAQVLFKLTQEGVVFLS